MTIPHPSRPFTGRSPQWPAGAEPRRRKAGLPPRGAALMLLAFFIAQNLRKLYKIIENCTILKKIVKKVIANC
jgi:hypothetical protein